MKLFIINNLRSLIGCLLILATCYIIYANEIDLTNITESVFAMGFFGSLIASLMLAFLIFVVLRPKIFIAKDIAHKRVNNQSTYKFKFVNLSLFAAFDVNIEAYLCTETTQSDHGQGMNVRYDRIPLTRYNWIHLERFKLTTSKTRYAPHCITVGVDIEKTGKEERSGKFYVTDLKTAIADNAQYIEFRITLKHSFSNLSRTYRLRYNTLSCIKDGKFAFGNTTKVK